MENFALLLMIPTALVGATVYRVIVLKLAARHPRIPKLLTPGSYAILALAALELLLLITLGPRRSGASFGVLFLLLHGTVFVLGTPALANVLVLRGKGSVASKGLVVVPLCTIVAEALLLLQYYVSERLCGCATRSGTCL